MPTKIAVTLKGLSSPFSIASDGSPAYSQEDALVREYVNNAILTGGNEWYGTYSDWPGLENMVFATGGEVIGAARVNLPQVLSSMTVLIQDLVVEGTTRSGNETLVTVQYRIRKSGMVVSDTFTILVGGAT